MVILDDIGEIRQFATPYPLVFPCKMIAHCHRGVGGIFLQELFLNIVHDGGAQEDAHRTATAGEKMQFLAFGHWRATLTTGEDDGLATLGDCKLRPQLGGCGYNSTDYGSTGYDNSYGDTSTTDNTGYDNTDASYQGDGSTY